MSIESPLWGVDVSNHQADTVNFGQVSREGFTFGVAKASQGTNFRDAFYRRNIEKMEEAGVTPGAYHWLENTNIKAQVDLFLSQIGGVRETAGKLVMVDVEPYGSRSPDRHDVWNFVHELKDRIGDHPILIYSGYYWPQMGNPDAGSLAEMGCRFWDARYVLGSAYASVLYQKVPREWWQGRWGNVRPSIIQFSDQGRVAGLSLDVNAFRGSREELLRLTKSSEQ